MITVEVDSLYAMLMSPVTPECINVESPMTATVRAAFFFAGSLIKPVQARDGCTHADRRVDCL